MFVKTRTLEYAEHRDELAAIGVALQYLMRHDTVGAIRVLLARQQALIEAQTPTVKDYDPREERCQS